MAYLNRIAWVASLALGLSIAGGELFILGIFIGIMFKLLVLPSHFFEGDTPMESLKVTNRTIETLPERSLPAKKEAGIPKTVAKKTVTPQKYEEPKPSKPNPLIAWFAENTLAKVGGLLIFVAIIAFLSVIYATIGPVGRLTISILVSLVIYGVGIYLYRNKNFIHESQIVMGVGIAAIYLSILYIFRVPVFVSAFGDALPSIILVLLTLAVIWGSITGMIYGSTTLFVFSIAFAYINPFLIGVHLTTYQSLLYTMLISGGALATARYLIVARGQESLGTTVTHIAFWGGTLLSLVTDHSLSGELNALLVTLVLLTGATTWVASLLRFQSSVSIFLIAGGLGLFVALLSSSLRDSLMSSIILGISIMGLFGLVWRSRAHVSSQALVVLMILPFILWFSGYLLGFWFAPVIAFGGMILIYVFLLIFFVAIPAWFASVLFILLGVSGVAFAPSVFVDLSTSSRYIMMGIGIFLFCFGHYFTLKRNISVTPIIHTLTSLGLLAVNRPGADPVWAILTVSLLAGATVGVSFYAYKGRLLSALDHICVPLIGAMSLVGTLLYFGTTWGLALGGILLVVATVYGVCFFVGLKPLEQKVSEYMTVTFLGITSAVITLAIAYLFSGHESARTLAWTIEAALIFGVYGRMMNIWVLLGATIVQIIGMIQFVSIEPTIGQHFMVFLVVCVAIFWNIWCLRKTQLVDGLLPDLILFLSSIFWFGYLIRSLDVLPGWSELDLLMISEALLVIHMIFMTWVKSPIYFGGLIVTTLGFFVSFSMSMDTSLVIYLLLPFVLLAPAYTVSQGRSDTLSRFMSISIGIALFLVSSQWVDGFFANEYMITVWWSLWIATLLFIGMKYDKWIYRSLGLLVYFITLGKIGIVDIWRILGSDGGLGVYIGIGIMMALGIVSIGLSLLYKKLMGEGALRQDFLFQGRNTSSGKEVKK